MSKRSKGAMVAAAAIVALGGAGTALAIGGADDDATETPIAAPALERATAAALAETGGGKVTGTEAGDEEGAYEVEVTRADGSQVDVHLDERFEVIGSSPDGDGDGDGIGEDDD